jgi:hypothetical protein
VYRSLLKGAVRLQVELILIMAFDAAMHKDEREFKTIPQLRISVQRAGANLSPYHVRFDGWVIRILTRILIILTIHHSHHSHFLHAVLLDLPSHLSLAF